MTLLVELGFDQQTIDGCYCLKPNEMYYLGQFPLVIIKKKKQNKTGVWYFIFLETKSRNSMALPVIKVSLPGYIIGIKQEYEQE